MTSETAILVLKTLVTYFPGKIVGLVWDSAPQHGAKEVKQWVENYNREHASEGSQIILELIDKSLTSIIQPPDVALIAVLKKIIRNEYHILIDKKLESGALQPGETLRITREDVVRFVETAVKNVNDEQATNPWIRSAIEKCGLNHLAISQTLFEQYMESLNKDGVYKVLTDKHTALKLDEAAVATQNQKAKNKS
jgi:hypothetical protein